MPNRVFKDLDLRHFSAKLRYTPEGKRFMAYWNDLTVVRKVLVGKTNCDKDPTGANLLRQSYIRLSDACSEALSDLEQRYHWPP